MINIYNWSYEIEKNLVRIEFGCTIKTKIQNIIQQFNGQQLSIAMGENVLIVKFKNAKVANDFVNYVISQYPNSFHLNNEWDASKSSETMISFTSMQGSQRSLLSLSETIASLFADSITISNLTKSKVVGIQVSADEDMCYLTFSINFKSSNDVEQFLIDFHRFKA